MEVSLSKQHTTNTLINEYHSKRALPYYIATSYPIGKQWLKVKSSIIDINNHLNEVLLYFDSLNKKLSLGLCLVDTFSDHFSFISVNWKDSDTLTFYCNRLKDIHRKSLMNQNTMLIIVDASVKNNIATGISHICRG